MLSLYDTALFTAVEILFYLVLVGWAAVLALVQVSTSLSTQKNFEV